MHIRDMTDDDEWRRRYRRNANRSPWCRNVGKRGNAQIVTIGDLALTFCQFAHETDKNLWDANDLTRFNL